jgi:uncharacterized protein YdaU (DUF1376 family)
MKQVKFVQLESGAFLTDVDFISMSAEQRGVYVTLILYLNCNNGRCRYDEQVLSALCNCEKFAQVWEKIKNKFTQKNGWIRHKRVSRELKAAKNRLQLCSKKGLKGAKNRWHKHGTSNGTGNACAIANVKRNVNVKERKDNTYTYTNYPSCSSTSTLRTQVLKFHSDLVNILGIRDQSDRTCFHNVTSWLVEGIASGRFNEQIFERVLEYAKEARGGRKPAAVFMALMKKELNYDSNKHI